MDEFKTWLMDDALGHGVTRGILLAVCAALLAAPVFFELTRLRGGGTALRRELYTRYFAWLVLVPILVLPILIGRVWTIAAVMLLGLFCWREFARATGAFRERVLSVLVVLGIALLAFAALDNWYGLFQALPALVVTLLVVAGLWGDRPDGYIQRVALAVFGFLLFGLCLGHFAYLANLVWARPILLALLLCTELNDVFAYCAGKLCGRRKLAPRTSPNKTLAGSLGAVLLTTALFALIGRTLFAGTALAHPVHLVAMGALLSIVGQLGDLVLSSIKRDLGVKDMAALIPGHGGLLDRFDSLLFVGPALFHYAHYFHQMHSAVPERVWTLGSW